MKPRMMKRWWWLLSSLVLVACQMQGEKSAVTSGEQAAATSSWLSAPPRLIVHFDFSALTSPDGKTTPWQPKYVLLKMRQTDTGKATVKRLNLLNQASSLYGVEWATGSYSVEFLRLADSKKLSQSWAPEPGARHKVAVTLNAGEVVDVGRWQVKTAGKKMQVLVNRVKTPTEPLVSLLHIVPEQHVGAFDRVEDDDGSGAMGTMLGSYQYRRETTMYVTVQLQASANDDAKKLSDTIMKRDSQFRECYHQRLDSLKNPEITLSFTFDLLQKKRALSRLKVIKPAAPDKVLVSCLRQELTKVAFEPSIDSRGRLTYRFSSASRQTSTATPKP